MTPNGHKHDVGVLVRLSPDDIRSIRAALRIFIQIHSRNEGYGDARHAPGGLPPEQELAALEAVDQLHALACACREAGLCEDVPQAAPRQAANPTADASAGGPTTERTRVRLTLPIIGFSRGDGGAPAVERLLRSRQGVLRASVNPDTEMAYVEYDDGQIDVSTLGELIELAGYKTVLPAAATTHHARKET